MRSRISIRGCVRPSVRRSVRPPVCWSVTHELKSCKSAVFDQNYWQYERERILCRVYSLVPITDGGRRRATHFIIPPCWSLFTPGQKKIILGWIDSYHGFIMHLHLWWAQISTTEWCIYIDSRLHYYLLVARALLDTCNQQHFIRNSKLKETFFWWPHII